MVHVMKFLSPADFHLEAKNVPLARLERVLEGGLDLANRFLDVFDDRRHRVIDGVFHLLDGLLAGLFASRASAADADDLPTNMKRLLAALLFPTSLFCHGLVQTFLV